MHAKSAARDGVGSLKGDRQIPEKGEGESQRETNMVVQDWEEKIAEHLLLNACSFRGTCINVE